MVSIARPVFDAGPSDKVQTVDVYNTLDSETRNALTSKLSTFGQGLTDIYGKSTQAIRGIGDRVGNGSIDLAEAKDRISKALGGSRSDINYLAEGLQNVIFEDVTGIDSGTNYVRDANGLLNQVKVITSKGARVFASGDRAQANALIGFITDLTGMSIFKTFDLGAEAALVKGILHEVSAWGVPDLLDDILSNIDESTARAAVQRSGSTLASRSDIDAIELMLNKYGPEVLTAEAPNFATIVLSSYRFKAGVTVADYPAKLTQLVGVMNRLQPNWFWHQRVHINEETKQPTTEEVANLAVLAYASDDATALLSSDDTYLKYVITAPFYPIKSSRTLLKSMYPYIAIT